MKAEVLAISHHHFGPHIQQGGGWDPPLLTCSLSSSAQSNAPNLKEGQKDVGTDEKRTRTVMLYFHMLKTKALWLCAILRLSLQLISPYNGNVALASTLLLDLKVQVCRPAAELRKRFCFKADYQGLQSSLGQLLPFNIVPCHLNKGGIIFCRSIVPQPCNLRSSPGH